MGVLPTKKNRRGLTSGEVLSAKTIFLDYIDYSKPRIIRGRYFSFQPDDTAMSPDGNVYFPPKIYGIDFSAAPSYMELLIHELTHVWQVQHGMWLKFRRVVMEGGVYDYGFVNPKRELNSYTVEQQA